MEGVVKPPECSPPNILAQTKKVEGYLILKKETLCGTTVVRKVAGSDTQWKEARKKEVMFLGKMGPKLPASDGGSVEK